MGTPNPVYRKTSLIEATLLHNEAKRLKQPIPHFKDESGALHYIDRRGKSSGGGQYFRDLASKIQTEVTRKALKTKQTPTKEMYIEIYGPKNGPELYRQEVKKRRAIYMSTDSNTHDVDHMDSMASGGVHHSRNLRSQPKSENRSDGARRLSKEAKNAMMLADNPRDQIKLQGPELLDKHRKQYFDKAVKRQPRISGFGGALADSKSSGSQIVDRVNGSAAMTGNAATLGIPLDLF